MIIALDPKASIWQFSLLDRPGWHLPVRRVIEIDMRLQMRCSVMNKWLLSLLLVVLMLGLAGCEMFSSGDEYGSLTFENASRSLVYVYALSTAWSDFVLPPGEIVKMKNIRDTDYRYEPKNKVQERQRFLGTIHYFRRCPPGRNS